MLLLREGDASLIMHMIGNGWALKSICELRSQGKLIVLLDVLA